MEQPFLLRAPFAWPALPRRGTKLYDLLMGMPLIFFYTLVSWTRFHGLIEDLSRLGLHDLSYAVVLGILSNASVLLVALVFVVSVTFRPPPIARIPGMMPRIAAFSGTYLTVALFVVVPQAASKELMAISTVVIFLGTLFAGYAIFHLGRSISLVAEARKLVTSGPYRLVRHPLYLGEEIAIAGSVLQHISTLSLLVFTVQLGFQFYRMSREEEILAQAFPEYQSYAKRTWRILPGIY